MKKQIMAIMLLISTLLINFGSANAAELYLLGKKPSEFTGPDAGKAVLGAAATIVVHELGHLITMEVLGIDYKINSPIRFTFESGDHDSIVAASGFVAETTVGVLLNVFHPDTPFTLGYTVAATIHPLVSPTPDFDHINGWTRPLFAAPVAVFLPKMIEIRW